MRASNRSSSSVYIGHRGTTSYHACRAALQAANQESQPEIGRPRPGNLPAETVMAMRRSSAAGYRLFGKRTCKPNFVVCGHSSRRRVTANAHQRPTRRFRPDHWNSLAASGRCRARALLRARASLPIWSCSVWGLPCLRHYCRSGALLPHLFTLTTATGPVQRAAPRSGGMFSVALAVHGP